jgi:hypothetical protein
MIWSHTCGRWRAGDYEVRGLRDLVAGGRPYLLLHWRGHCAVEALGTFDALTDATGFAEIYASNQHE